MFELSFVLFRRQLSAMNSDSRRSNNNIVIKPKKKGCCHSCFNSNRPRSEDMKPKIITRKNTSTEAYRDNPMESAEIIASEITCYQELFVQNSDSSRYTLKRKTSLKIVPKIFVICQINDTKLSSGSIEQARFLNFEVEQKSQNITAKSELKEVKIMEETPIESKIVMTAEKIGKEELSDITLDWMKTNLINTEYRCDHYIGEGTFGKVFSCVDIQSKDKMKVAIKVNKKFEKYRKLAMHEISLLNRVKKYDPGGQNFIVILKDWFDLDGHILLVFPEYGENLYRYLKFNNHIGIKLNDVRHISIQLWKAVKFLHSLTIIHTDIKPENLLLVSKGSQNTTSEVSIAKFGMLPNPDIVLIDLGNGISNSDSKPKVIVTRYYRAPEVYLELGWDQSVDVWSIGCVMFELYTGRSLFQCRGDVEHLWMMQYVLKKFPKDLIEDSLVSDVFFDEDGNVLTNTIEVYKLKMRMQGYEHFINDKSNEILPLMELINLCLKYNPKERITTKEALLLPFLS